MDKTFEDYANIAINVNKIFAVLMPLVMLMMNICTILIVWFGGKQVVAGSIEIGDIMAIIEYAMLTLAYLVMGISVFIFIPRAQTCAGRINAVLEKTPEFSKGVSDAGKGSSANDADVKVEFRDVTFRYEDAEEAVLHNINFAVRKGTTTAIIGSTGSGKSTIANLVMRFSISKAGIS